MIDVLIVFMWITGYSVIGTVLGWYTYKAADNLGDDTPEAPGFVVGMFWPLAFIPVWMIIAFKRRAIAQEEKKREDARKKREEEAMLKKEGININA